MEKRVPHEQLCGIFQYYENRTENISKKQHRKTCLCRNQCLASGAMDASDCSFSDFWIVCVSVIRAFESDEEHEKTL